MNYRPTTTDQQLLADEIKVRTDVMFDKFLKARTLRELQYNTPEENAEDGTCEFLSKCIAVMHTNAAREMRTKGNLVKEKELKNSLLDIESKVLNVAEKTIHVNLTELDTLEMYREFEKCFKLLSLPYRNIYVSMVRDMFPSIFNQTKETAEVQQISEIELD